MCEVPPTAGQPPPPPPAADAAHQVILSTDNSAANATLMALTKEGENGPNMSLQEKFHRGILRGVRNISDTP